MTVFSSFLVRVHSQGSKLTLARGDWKPRGMSRIFAQVVRRASGYFNLFCQLCVTMNETNY